MKNMNKRLISIGLAQALLTTSVLADHPNIGEFALEPSINGGVSATGQFASQAEEDRYLLERAALALEPCINGGVSMSGGFASQYEEDQWIGRLAGN